MWHVRIMDIFIYVCVSPFLLFSWSVSTEVEKKVLNKEKSLRACTLAWSSYAVVNSKCEFRKCILLFYIAMQSQQHLDVCNFNAFTPTGLFFPFFVWYWQCTLHAVCAKYTSVVKSTFQWVTQECNDILVWCRWANERNKMERVHKESVYT